MIKIGLYLIFCLSISSSSTQIYLRHGLQFDEEEIYKLFYDISDGYYMDIGAYDPILFSTTITLYSIGWSGLNFEASPTRSARFPYGKPNDINLNYAVGQGGKFVTLYDRFDNPSMSTLIPEVVGQKGEFNSTEKKKNQDEEESNDKKDKIFVKVNVPSISMKQICEKLLIKTANFLNLDVQGYGSAVLISNDWNNPKCRPDVIMSQFNAFSKMTNLKSPKQILEQNGYKYFMDAGINQIFIQNSKFEFYKKNYQKGSREFSRIRVITFDDVLKLIKKDLNLDYEQNFIDNSIDPIYLHYPKEGSIVNLIQVNALSNQVCYIKNRPIIIFLFNPFNTYITVPNAKYQVNRIQLGQYYFTHLTVKKYDKQKFVAYIFDRQIQQSKYGWKTLPSIISPSQAEIVIPQSTFKLIIILIIAFGGGIVGYRIWKKKNNHANNLSDRVEISSTQIK